MPFPASISGSHPLLAESDIRRLLRLIFSDSGWIDDDADGAAITARILSGGYSGALVLLVWAPDLPAFVVKAGPSEKIKSEHLVRNARNGSDPWLAEHRLDAVFGPIEVEVGNQSAEWSAMCYTHIAGRDFAESDHFVDFSDFARGYVAESDRDLAPTRDTVLACFKRVVEVLAAGPQAAPENRGRSLAAFLPDVPWDAGARSALLIASALCPDLDELRDFEAWYKDAAMRIQPAPVADHRLLHGDARLANIIVNKVRAEVHFIDFGSGRTGHVYEDLARFELDLILSTAPRHPDSHELIQDDLLATFALALRDDLALHDVSQVPRAANCLRLWRQAMATAPAVGDDLPGAPIMYRWFLLAECLRRLRWIATNGEAAAGVDAPSLLQLIVTLRSRLDRPVPSVLTPVATPSNGLRALNCVAVYVPLRGRERTVNDQRNEAKRQALASAGHRASTVRVLAETGFSYLSSRGVFRDLVHDLLSNGGGLRVVICNPASPEAYGISASYGTQPGPLNAGPWAGGLYPALDDKFRASLRGYHELREEYRELIELRMAFFGISATLLLTDDMYFYEPYFRDARRRRERLIFDTFEMQFRPTGLHSKTLLEETFSFHWGYSEPVPTDGEGEDRWQALREQVFRMWRGD